ncbi:hypothetical protein [Microbacterium testaceum]|uniref:DUF7507 domain-containing protein n=1 Tax=Microbacterium testaceum TaxID=2033 RepID=UPI002AC71D24|nr:hypothetical protein [Microbacterium testaceum]MDZ5146143.1 hypothetical protein [Microbacterium testaceum]
MLYIPPRPDRKRSFSPLLTTSIALIFAFSAASPAALADTRPEVIWEAQSNDCYFSWQDTNPDSSVAYGIVEAPAESDHRCELTLTGPGQFTTAQITVTAGPGVAYLAEAGTYQYRLVDTITRSTSDGTILVTGAPALPTPGPGSMTGSECIRSFENRTVAGHLAVYNTGWNVVTAAPAATCGSTATANSAPYAAESTGVQTQVALVEPFGLTLTKVATKNEEAVTSALVGDEIVYLFTLANTGSVPWTVVINDPLPGLGPVVCPADVLDPATKMICSADYIVSAADADSSKLTNTAFAVGTDTARSTATGASWSSIEQSVTIDIVRPVAAEPTPTSLTATASPTTPPAPATPERDLPTSTGTTGALAKTGTDVRLATTIWAIAGVLVGCAFMITALRRRNLPLDDE